MGAQRAASLLLLAMVLGTAGMASSSSLAEEAKALLDLKAAVKNPKDDFLLWDALDTWNGSNPCDPKNVWTYVDCVGGHVDSVAFFNLGIIDDPENQPVSFINVRIGASFANLDKLKRFSIFLANSAFPRVVTRLLQLEYLYLRGASGSIPTELGQLRRLKKLDLAQGTLRGSIPETIGQLTSLQSLQFYFNQLSGPIPSTIGKLTNLVLLSGYDNRLTMSIPPQITKLRKLRKLYFNDNRLTGNILSDIGKMTSLVEINLAGNRLSGPIPRQLSLIPGLYFFSGGMNMLTGNVPPELVSKVGDLRLFTNYLTGPPIPDSSGLNFAENCFGITECNRTVAGQRPFAQCAKVYPDLSKPCRQ